MPIDQPQVGLDQHQQRRVADKVHEELGQSHSNGASAQDLKRATEAQVQAGIVPALQIVSSMATDIGKGFYQEVTQHPGELLKDAAFGAATGLVMGIVSPELAMVAGAYVLGKGVYDLATHVPGWVHDGTVAADPSQYSAAQVEKAHKELQSVGAETADFAASIAGGVGTYSFGRSIRSRPAAATAGEDAAKGSSTPATVAGAEGDSAIVGKAAKDGVLSVDETGKLFDSLKQKGKTGMFAKPELRPGDPKYYQVSAEQVRLQDGLEHRVSTTEAKIGVTAQSPLSNGIELPPKTELPNGAQLSGRTIITPKDGIWLADRTGEMRFLKTSVQLPADAQVSGGQVLSDKDWVIMRRTSVEGRPGYDVQTPHDESMVPAGSPSFQQRWKSVMGQPGQYSPKSVPTEMGFLEKGLSDKIQTGWGVQGGKGPLFLPKYGEGDFNLITVKDHAEIDYRPLDQRAKDILQSQEYLKAKEQWTKAS
jgi:hypothetical protein